MADGGEDNNQERGRREATEIIDLTQTDEEDDDNQQATAGRETENSVTAAEPDDEKEKREELAIVADLVTSDNSAERGRRDIVELIDLPDTDSGIVDTSSVDTTAARRSPPRRKRDKNNAATYSEPILTAGEEDSNEDELPAAGTTGDNATAACIDLTQTDGEEDSNEAKHVEKESDAAERKDKGTASSRTQTHAKKRRVVADRAVDDTSATVTPLKTDNSKKTGTKPDEVTDDDADTDDTDVGKEDKSASAGAKRMRKSRKKRIVGVAETVNDLNLLFVLGNRSSTEMAVPLNTEMGQNFRKGNASTWKKFDVLQLLLGKDGTFEEAGLGVSERVDFRQQGSKGQARELIKKWSMTKAADRLFRLEDEKTKFVTHGCNAVLAQFVLEMFSNPSIGPLNKTRILSNHPNSEKEDDPMEHAHPFALYTRLDALINLIEKDPVRTAKYLSLNFDILVLPETRDLSATTRRKFLEFVHTRFEVGGNKLSYPPREVLKALAPREDVEEVCRTSDCDVKLLDTAFIEASKFSGDENFWNNCFLTAMKDLEAGFSTKDRMYTCTEIMDHGLVCKVRSDEDASCRVVFLDVRNKVQLDTASARYMETDLNLAVKDREDNSVEGDFSDKTLHFEPYVDSFKKRSTSVFVEMKFNPICHYFVEHPSLEVKNGDILPKTTLQFCRDVVQCIKNKDTRLLWAKQGHWKVMVRLDIFKHAKVWYLNQVNLVTTCDAFIKNGGDMQSSLALRHLADSIKSFVETKWKPTPG